MDKKMNEFIKQNIMSAGANNTYTENGAISYCTTGSKLIDQFGKAGTARGRDLNEVWNDQNAIWNEDKLSALRFPFYLRMITRQTTLFDGNKTSKVQRGLGARDESFKRLLWLAKYQPDTFYRNLWLLPIVGSWKDLWVLMAFDGADKYLDYNKFFSVIAEGINDDNHRDLVKKFMPRIRSEKACTTPWAKRTNALAKQFAKAVGWSYKEYREFKATGVAHEFQKYMCAGLYDKIDWNKIPGQALLGLVTGNFLKNHNLEGKYLQWLEKQPVVKFNGYAFDLGMKLGRSQSSTLVSRINRMTIDKQFANLIKTAKSDDGSIKGNVLCALDTSGSMSSRVDGGPADLTSYDVCVSLGIYFSELNEGAFHNVVAMFDDTSRLKTLSGTFSDKWFDIQSSTTAWGSTNFQSLIDLICRTKQQKPNIPLEDFPQTLLVVSDMQFNPVGGNTQSNYEAAMAKLRRYFPEEWVANFKIIWWQCASCWGARRLNDVPSTLEHGGTYFLSGFDGSVVSLLLGGEQKPDGTAPTMEELAQAALSQEVLALAN
jgi:hypothetical protein